VLSDYRSRDRAEKLFDLLKNEDGQYRLRTGRQAVAEGRILLGFLALVLRTELENRMRTAGLLKRASTAGFLAEMGRIRAVRLPDGTRLVREVTRRQREWLQAVGLQPPQP
jgi:transposase